MDIARDPGLIIEPIHGHHVFDRIERVVAEIVAANRDGTLLPLLGMRANPPILRLS
jgi:hypothetical protein